MTEPADGSPEYATFYPVHAHHHPGHPHHEMPMRHAFIIVGGSTVFLCHQVMGFMEGHNFELILEVELHDRKAFDGTRAGGNTLFFGTAPGAEHTLTALKAGHVTRLDGEIYDHFPHPSHWGKQWPWQTPPRLPDVDATLRRIVHYRHLDFNVLSRRYESYLLFGKGDEAHLAHIITGQPDYDHVLSLEFVPDWIQQHQLEAGVIVSFPDLPWRRESRYCVNPLPPGRYEVQYFGQTAYRDYMTGDTLGSLAIPKLEVQVAETSWFSTRVVNFFPENPCTKHVDIPTPV